MALYPYTQARQIEKYIHQFMRVMGGFQASTGDRDENGRFITKRVPVVYGSMSRIVASKLNNRTWTSNHKLPMMAVNMTSLEPAPDKARSPNHVETIVTTDHEDVPRAVERLVGPPFRMSLETSIYASSAHELFLLLEQILLVFNDQVTIQNSSSAIDHNYITEVGLESMQNEIQYPMGMNKNVVMFTLVFAMPIRLRYPFKDNTNFIEVINKNVFEESEEEDVELDGLYQEINGEGETP